MGCVGMFGLVVVLMVPFVALGFDHRTAFAVAFFLAVCAAVLAGALSRRGRVRVVEEGVRRAQDAGGSWL